VKYRTIVADPPWQMGTFGKFAGYEGPRRPGHSSMGSEPMPYQTMTVDAIKALPVADLAAAESHLYLWTTDRFLEAAHAVVCAWGFEKSQTLVWAKAPRGQGPGGAFATTTEFVLVCRRGNLPWRERIDTTWFSWKRHYEGGYPVHSAKPDGFLDLVERMSPGPYVELFARRARFGWDYWGNESLGTAEFAA
jgi:N6-adenosine-specific RNA methylase IME4